MPLSVTSLEPAGSGGASVRVHLSDDTSYVLTPAQVRRLGLEAGRTLSGPDAERLRETADFREARGRALDYLSHRDRTRRELERYLRRKGYEEPVVSRVVERCEELDYLDDRRFAEGWVRDRIRLKPRGRIRLRAELREKGVDPDEAEAAIERAFREADVSERDLLERAARKRWKARRSDDPRTVRRRLVGYLQRRGFPFAEIRQVVDELMDQE